MRLPTLVAAGGAAWEADLVASLAGDTAPLAVARRCVDVVDLLSAAAAGLGRAAIVSADLRRLDADAVDRLHAADVVPVGVVTRGAVEIENRLRALGIEHLVPSDAEPSVIVSVVLDAVTGAADAAVRNPRGFADPATSITVPPGSATALPADAPSRQGTVIAVWGPTGAPGRTTIAMTLADELARLDRSTLLVDADVYGGTVAAALGLLDESPGLAAACRLASATRIDAASLAGLCWQLRTRLRVLTGIPFAARWTELRPAGVTAVLGAARRLADVTVVDCGFCLETDEELSFDSVAPRRNGATLAILDAADHVVVVGAADPIGVQRLVRALGDLRDAEIDATPLVVLNKVRRGVVPGDPAAELTGALQLFAGVSPAAFVPYDRSATDDALASGRSVGEARPSSAIRTPVAEFGAQLLGIPTTGTHRRRKGVLHS